MMENLPEEIILHIASLLEAEDILPLQLVCRHLLKISRDAELWKHLCFDNCHLVIAQRLKDNGSTTPIPIPEPRVFELQRAVTRSITASNLISQHGDGPKLRKQSQSQNSNKQKFRNLVSWDPSYPSERVNWYDEYISRHAVLSTSWIQQPIGGLNGSKERREIRGLGFRKNGKDGIIVAPLDDGSICLWNIGSNDDLSNTENGHIIARSKAGLLSANDPGSYSNSIRQARRDIGATPECVSVDRRQNKAYVAVGEDLNEIDLETLQVVSREIYPSKICALSDASYPTPLTVGANLSLSIHDNRLSHNAKIESEQSERLESLSALLTIPKIHNRSYKATANHDSTCHFPPFQPLSILHLPTADGSHDAQNGLIYATGRIRSIVAYDRRTFPKLHRVIHSGAHLCSLADAPASCPTPAIIACGEYNGKGSLEFYPLSLAESPSPAPPAFKNRVSASSSLLLSVVPHGTRFVFSDGNGMLKWVERDGSTLVRKWNINESQLKRHPLRRGLFANMNQGSEDVAMKLLSTGDGARDELLFWTGEKIGVVGFRKEARFVGGEGGRDEEGEAAIFGERMRRVLERQADEVRFMRGLGLRA